VAFVDGHPSQDGAASNRVASFGSVLCYIGPNVDTFVQNYFQSTGHIPGLASWATAKQSS